MVTITNFDFDGKQISPAFAGLHNLQCGSVKLFKTSPHGRELIIRVLEEGATFNEVPVFDRGTNPVNAAAQEESEIWVVEVVAIRDAMHRHPGMCAAFISNLALHSGMILAISR